MSTGLLTGRRNLSWVLAVAVVAALTGCGDGSDDDGGSPPEKGSLVPAGTADTTVVDTTAAVVSESAYVAGTLTEDGGVTVDPDSGEQAAPPPEVKELRTEDREVGKVQKAETRPATSNSSGDGAYSLQLGSFSNLENARKQAERIRGLGYAPVIEDSNLGGQTYHRVMLRDVGDMAAASRLGETIHSKLGIAYLVRRGN